MVIKSALILGQANAESERSLSVNARVVTQDRTLLNEETIVGLRVIKEAIRFSDTIYHQPEKIVITEELKRSVRGADGAISGLVTKRSGGTRKAKRGS